MLGGREETYLRMSPEKIMKGNQNKSMVKGPFSLYVRVDYREGRTRLIHGKRMTGY
jgi:hypothetical protein